MRGGPAPLSGPDSAPFPVPLSGGPFLSAPALVTGSGSGSVGVWVGVRVPDRFGFGFLIGSGSGS